MAGRSDGGRGGARVFILAYYISPTDGRYLKLRTSFAAAGFDVTAAAPHFEGLSLHESVAGVEPGPSLPTPAGAWLRARRIAAGLVAHGAAFGPDVIYAFDPEALPAAAQLKQRTGARLIYDAHEFHEDEDPSNPARGTWVKRTELKLAGAIDAFVTVNKSIAELYAKERPGLPGALVVHNSVDPPAPAAYDGRLHRAAGLAPEKRALLYQGAFAPLRGLDRLIAAAPLLSADWHVVLMGSGGREAVLRTQADAARVSFLPSAPHTELLTWTRGAALGALLYEDIGRNQHFCSPNKLWEYPAGGVPILASDLPEVARVVRGGGVGWLVAADAGAEAIAAAVNRISDAELSAVSARAGTFAATQTWTTEAVPLLALIARLSADV